MLNQWISFKFPRNTQQLIRRLKRDIFWLQRELYLIWWKFLWCFRNLTLIIKSKSETKAWIILLIKRLHVFKIMLGSLTTLCSFTFQNKFGRKESNYWITTAWFVVGISSLKIYWRASNVNLDGLIWWLSCSKTTWKSTIKSQPSEGTFASSHFSMS